MKRKLFLACSLLILAAACDTKDPASDTPTVPEPAQLLYINWSKIGTGLTIPESYTFTAAPAATPAEPVYTATLTGAENLLDHYFAPGTYRFLTYNTPEHITVSGTSASAARVPSPVDDAGDFIHNSPDWLFTGCAEKTVTKDAVQLSVVTMKQQVREFTILINFSGDRADQIERIEGYLIGAASVYDFADDSYGTPATRPATRSQTSSSSLNHLTSTTTTSTRPSLWVPSRYQSPKADKQQQDKSI